MSSAIQVKQNPPACSQPLLSCPEGGANEGHDYSADSGVSEQDGEPPSPYTEACPLLTETRGLLEKEDDSPGEHQADHNRRVISNVGLNGNPEVSIQSEICTGENLKTELGEEVPNECDMKTDSDSQTHRKSSSPNSSHKSLDNGICNTGQLIAIDDNEKSTKRESVMIDMSTQTSPNQENVTILSKVNKTDSSEKGGHCVCNVGSQGNVPCNYCSLQSSCDDTKIGVVKSSICRENMVYNLEDSDSKQDKDKTDGPNMRQKRTSDYSSLSSCDSPRVSDSSNRTSDSGNSPSSSSSSSCSTASGQSKRLRSSAFTKKITAVAGGLSPIASCGGESNTGLSVDVSLVPEDITKESGGRSPCTPTSGCLKAGTRSTSGAHVQFETPCDDYEDSRMLQDTLVTSDGRVSLHKPGVTSTPTSTDHLSRFWSKLVSDSSPSEAVSSNLHRSKKYRKRHISGSSSISVGSSSSDSGESHTTEFERKAPDGGWGWVIVAASFMVHCIADGVTMSFGVLFVELLNYFSVGKSLTSWVGSLFMAIPLLAGPLASILTDRYGCRTVTICGAVVACFGFFVSAFVNTFPLLLLTVGIVTGLGLAVCYVAAIVIVAFYFERKRSLATGIAVAGSGIGTFLFAPLIQYLVDYWGWRLCLIILAGIFLNMVVCGALMHDLEWTPKYSSNVRDGHTAASSRRSSTSQSSETGGGKGGSVGTTLPSLDELRRLVQSGDIMISPDESPNEKLRNSASLVLLPTFLSRSQVLPPDVLPCLSSRTNAYEVVSQIYPHLLSHSMSGLVNQATDQMQVPVDKQQHQKCTDESLCRYKDILTDSIVSSTGLLLEDSNTSPISPQQPTTTENDYCDTETTTPGSTQGDISFINGSHRKKVDIELGCSGDDGDDADNEEEMEEAKELTAMLGRSRVPRLVGQRRISTGCMGSSPPPPAAPLRNMRINRQSMMYRGAMLNINRYRLRASSCPDIYRNSIITIAKSEDENMWTYLDDMGDMITSCVDYSYCLDPGYLVFAISNFILYVFYDTVYMYLTDYAQGVGVSADDSANLISVIGILNCFGMVVMGYVGDRPWSSPMLIYNVSMILCGVSVIMMPFLSNYWLIAAASAVFGLFISANYALTSVILVELITLEAFSKAYGLLLLIQGIANLIGPPLVGLIADTTGDYTMPFVISGIFIIFCGVILNLIPMIHCCQGKYAASVTSTPVDTPKNGSPTSSPNHTFSKKKPTPI